MTVDPQKLRKAYSTLCAAQAMLESIQSLLDDGPALENVQESVLYAEDAGNCIWTEMIERGLVLD